MNFIAKHLIGGATFVISIILLIVGLFSEGESILTTIGTIGAIGAIVFMAYNFYRGIFGGGIKDAVNEMTFGSKASQQRRSSRRLDLDDFDIGGDD